PFLCWGDSDHWFEATGPGGVYYLSTASYNTIQETFKPMSPVMYVSPSPPGAPGPYIGSIFKVITGNSASRMIAVSFLKKDLSEGRNVWSSTTFQPLDIEVPRVDPLGENV